MGIFSSIFGAKALKKANKSALAAQETATKEATAQFDPYAAAGASALPAYLNAIGQGDSNAAIQSFQNSPLYQLQYGAAMKAGQDNTAAMGNAAGLRNSGATLKALQDRASQTTNNAFQQYISPLAGLNEMGLGIADRKAGLLTNQGQNQANYFMNKGQIKAGQMAGFDGLLSSGLTMLGGFGGFGSGSLGQGLGEKFGFAKTLY